MKKFLITILCIVLAFSLIACGEKPADDSGKKDAEQGENNGGETAPDTYVASVNGTDVWVKADMAKLKAKLGEPTSYFESESCAFQGLDKVYTYGSVIIRTYPDGGNDYVLSIELKDDTVTTKEGIFIGSSKDEIISAYGEATGDDTALVYKKGDTELTFILADGSASAITYTIAE